ncbi:hypothetical protein CTAM01_15451 [Colletotrichum tamarilloi]|uniref:Uncharacterized protein n=1 Tax=Colletotrichum tamarilloi TaxID=1209934 RepID=A0ABQ9QLA7_9PEZI|nr:uncharacterized protein CTAM01_15451 [Colletotrichum tamarilloi]KAK1476448.1 hypothetical protein CTAM01_15451 [Colletotrichum tamarilloi]
MDRMNHLSTGDRLLQDLETSRQRPLRRRSTGDIRNDIDLLHTPTSQLLSTQDTESQDNSSGADSTPVQDEAWMAELTDGDRVSTWRPWWLRLIVLSNFSAVFLSFAIVLSIITWYSQAHGGMFEARMKGVEVICRFALTAKCDLDYTSMIFPTLLFRSLKHKHHFLFLVATVSLLFKIQIVLSPGLFRTADVEVGTNSTLLLTDVFSLPQNYTVNFEVTNTAWYVALNIRNFNVSYPFGATKEAAYQRFTKRGSEKSIFTATVEALFMDFQCLKLEKFKTVDRINQDSNDVEFVLDLQFEGCRTLPFHVFHVGEMTSRDLAYWIYNDTLSAEQRCSNIPQARQFIYLIASFNHLPMAGSHTVFPRQVSAVICGSDVRLSKAEISDNGTNPILKETKNISQQKLDVDIWAMIVKTFPTSEYDMNWRPDTNFAGMEDFTNPVWYWQHFNSGLRSVDSEPGLLNTTEVLYESVTGLASHLGILFGHYRMRQDHDTKTDLEIKHKSKRIIIHFPTAISMLGIFGLTVLISAHIIVRYERDSKPLHMDPATPIGSLVFLHDHPTVTSRILDLQDEGRLESWPRDSSVPYVMRPWIRIVFTVTSIGVSAGIVATFVTSQTQAGIGSPGGYCWFADKTMIQGLSKYDSNVCRLIIGKGEGDLPYPKGTYDNLIFPDITLPPIPSRNVSLEVEMAAASLEPHCTRVADETGGFKVARREISKETGSLTDYDADIYFDVTIPNGTVIKFNETVLFGNNKSIATQRFFALGNKISGTTTRLYLWGNWKVGSEEVTFVRAWHCDYSWKKTMMNVNMSVVNSELVIDQKRPPRPVQGSTEPWNPQFSFANYYADQSIWPDSSEDRDRSFDMDKEMMLVLKPYGPLELEALGDPSQENNVKTVITHNWAFLHAQIANKKNRLSLNESAISVILPPEGLPLIKAKLIDHSRRRLFQNPVATYLILVILCLVIIVHLLMLVPKAIKIRLGWKTELPNMDVEGLAPDGFNSISRLVTLLHSSNAIQHMPSQALPQDELLEQLEHLRFRFGWFERQADKTEHFTIGVEGDAGFVFLRGPKEGGEAEPKPASL